MKKLIFDLSGGDPLVMNWVGENLTYPEAQEINCFRMYDNKVEQDMMDAAKRKHG